MFYKRQYVKNYIVANTVCIIQDTSIKQLSVDLQYIDQVSNDIKALPVLIQL